MSNKRNFTNFKFFCFSWDFQIFCKIFIWYTLHFICQFPLLFWMSVDFLSSSCKRRREHRSPGSALLKSTFVSWVCCHFSVSHHFFKTLPRGVVKDAKITSLKGLYPHLDLLFYLQQSEKTGKTLKILWRFRQVFLKYTTGCQNKF